MTNFVLVHGAWRGGWCWRRVARVLRAAGHDVLTPTLTGLGERAHLMTRETNLSAHIQDVLAVLRWEGLSDVVLCGHSYGGMVVSGVADQAPERIRSLVYLDAFVPKDGESVFELLPPERSLELRKLAAECGRTGAYLLRALHRWALPAEKTEYGSTHCAFRSRLLPFANPFVFPADGDPSQT